jgi:hypothetical protein
MRYRMPALLFSAALMSGQDKHLNVVPVSGGRGATLDANQIERSADRYPSTVHLKGSVTVRIPVCLPSGEDGKQVCDGFTIIRADEAPYHEDTGEIEATGSVRVIPLCHESEPCHRLGAK